MKIASSSACFERSLSSGNLTQLEWLDLCAHDLKVDGVVLDARHFPRIDDEYLAQIKKFCTDLGLCIAAVATDEPLAIDPDIRWLARARDLGAPLLIVRAPQAGDTFTAWNELSAAGQTAAAEAKLVNVTIALRNAPGTLCADIAAMKRLAKDIDSAWIRFAPDIAKLAPMEELTAILPRALIAAHDVESNDGNALGDLPHRLEGFRGFLALDRLGEGIEEQSLAQLVAELRDTDRTGRLHAR